MFQSFFNDFFAICGLGEISKDEESFNTGIFASEVSNSGFDFSFWGKSIEDNIESLLGERVSNAKSDSAERSCNESDFVVFAECAVMIPWDESFLEIGQSFHFVSYDYDIIGQTDIFNI